MVISLLHCETLSAACNVHTLGHARSPSLSRLIVLSSCFGSRSFSISSFFTPFDSKNATFLSHGASRMAGSSRNLEACSSNNELPNCDSSFSSGIDSDIDSSGSDVVVFGSASSCSCDSSFVSGSEESGDWRVAACARCQEGMPGLSVIFTRVSERKNWQIECSGVGRGW